MAGFWLLAALILATLSSAEAQKIPSYFKLGGTLVLRPSFSGRITSIFWKFKGNLAAEWAADVVPLTYYASFNGRTTLNTETGELVINNMSKDDIGEFVVEINNVPQDQRFEAVEIKDVPDPVVHLRPLSCGSASPNCSLWCYGDITESGPVTFSWRKGDGEWTESQQVMEITNDEETKKIQTFSCRMKNPVSEKESQSELNPFLEKTTDSGEAQKIPSYFKLGGTLVLRPSFSGRITSIVWKFRGYLAAEWADVGVPLTYYTSFNGRTTLNPETGELVINNMRKDDSGEFVVEINNVPQDQRFEAVEIKDVPEPEVHLRPLT